MRPSATIFVLAFAVVLASLAGCQGQPAERRLDDRLSPYAVWDNGPPADPEWFPICVWLQDPELAPQYKAIGVNTFMGLWEGPTEEQLTTLSEHGMKVICEQNDVGLAHRDDPTIIAWMHGDEPDNRKQEYGGPVPLEKILEDYHRIRHDDPTRPVLLNLGQGVANEEFGGRAIGYDQYPDYIRGADVVSYDVYPVANFKSTDADGNMIRRDDGDEHLWLVARGVTRLRNWTRDRKPVWNVIECTHISNPDHKATPHQVRAEVWMSLIHGSRGITWFVHQWEPEKNTAQLLADDEMREAVGQINREVLSLAPALNAPAVPGGVVAWSDSVDVPVSATAKYVEGTIYVFSVAMAKGPATGTFVVPGLPETATAEVIGEGRRLRIDDGKFTDNFGPWDVHLYRIRLQGTETAAPADGDGV